MNAADAGALAKVKAVHRVGGVRIGDATGQLPASTALKRFDAAVSSTLAKVGAENISVGFANRLAAARRRLGTRS